MIRWFADLDRLLRGEATRPDALRRGTIEVSVPGLLFVSIVLAAVYGVCMGSYALFREGGPSGTQLVASAVKVPALFYLTLVVTFPSLYVSNALVGSRLGPIALLRLVVAAIAVMVAVLASLGPIVAFFSVMTTSYRFVLLLNVVVCAVSGGLGLRFLLNTLQRLSMAELHTGGPVEVEPIDESAAGRPAPSAIEPVKGQVMTRPVRLIFRCWVFLFGVVGAQMAWVLRPFVGDPNQPFTWFRPRQSNFFEAVWHSLLNLFG